jgi:hypothetical protein
MIKEIISVGFIIFAFGFSIYMFYLKFLKEKLFEEIIHYTPEGKGKIDYIEKKKKKFKFPFIRERRENGRKTKSKEGTIPKPPKPTNGRFKSRKEGRFSRGNEPGTNIRNYFKTSRQRSIQISDVGKNGRKRQYFN